jgi:Holliday junction resolvase RusA-like endonuclease
MSEAQKEPAVNCFMIEQRLPSLNDYIRACRSHWSKGHEFMERVEMDIIWAIKAAKGRGLLHPTDKRIVVHIEWHESDMRRDVDNIVSAKKFILDAMQKAGIIPDDNRKHVAGVYDEVIDDEKDYVLVKLQEI